MQKRIIIVDDHAIVRAGLVEVLQRRGDLVVVGEAADASTAMRLVAQHAADLVIVDVSLDVGMNGIELVKHLRLQHPRLAIIVLSMHDEGTYAERAFNAGASGYVVKRSPVEALYDSIDRVLRTPLANKVSPKADEVGATRSTGVDLLSDRELEVLELIGRGHGTREISESLHLSIKTIETYRANIKHKLSIETAPQLVRYAVQWLALR